MKKLIFLFSLLFISTLSIAQKGKSKIVTKNIILSKVDNISAEMITVKKEKKVVLLVKKETIDTLEIKNLVPNDFKPENFTIKSFMTNGKKFYHISWVEKINTTTKLKTETGLISENQIWDVETKNLLLGNTHKALNIKEKIFLDANKTASHDVEKNRKEGFDFVLNTDGSINLSTKTQNSVYVYNTESNKYVLKSTPVSKTTSKKKR
uniref:hypothetical protein n=1 Tax=Flavobacterium sp. TaxID=239 RepID=UPI004049E077